MKREGFMYSRETVHADKNKHWKDAEDRYISAHRADGYVLISEGLKGRGFDRTPDAVRVRARRKLGVNLKRYPEDMEPCVCCGKWYARPGTRAGRAGFCPSCWNRRKAAAIREGREEAATEREYQREKKRRRDARKKGENTDGGIGAPGDSRRVHQAP